MSDSRVRGFPAGRQIALTWSIPESFGGLTAAMLRRSGSFSALGGVGVDVLTLDPQENRLARDQTLKERDALAEGVRVENLYDWLREHPLPGGTLRLERDVFTPLEPNEGSAERDVAHGPIRRVVRVADDGSVLQIDHLRPDGTLLLSDRRDCRERGTSGGRSVVLCDTAGDPVRSWKKIWHLYTAWLDRITSKAPTFLIVDSKVVARFAASYRRPHVTTVHVIHGSHHGPRGAEEVRVSRREVFAHLDDFDAVVFLTSRQERDVRALVGPEPHLVTIPNSLPAAAPEVQGKRTGTAIVARFEPLKQVDHAIKAVQLVNASSPEPMTLDVYGDGRRARALHELAENDPHIRFHGFVSDVNGALQRASILLMTSRSEAFALAIGEAMAVGCLPIAYDISYGPSDFITHGRDGWLVPPGDIDALARALAEARGLSESRLARMRKRARKRAEDFSEHRVTQMWAKVLKQAGQRAQQE